MFCQLVRFRYLKEIHDNKHSFLNLKTIGFSDLREYDGWIINLSLVNYNDQQKHKYLQLYSPRDFILQNYNGELKGIIRKELITLNFIEIVKLQNNKYKKNEFESKTLKVNCRIKIYIENPVTYESCYYYSPIIRNKSVHISDKFLISSWGRPVGEFPWKTLVINLKENVPYYPEEVSIIIDENEIISNKQENGKLQFNSYSFVIPKHIIESAGKYECILKCDKFRQVSDGFQIEFCEKNEINERKMKDIEVLNESCKNNSLTKITSFIEEKKEPPNQKLILKKAIISKIEQNSVRNVKMKSMNENSNEFFDGVPEVGDYKENIDRNSSSPNTIELQHSNNSFLNECDENFSINVRKNKKFNVNDFNIDEENVTYFLTSLTDSENSENSIFNI